MHRQRPYLDRPPVALAHRGGALYAANVGLENTLTAFRNAADLGYTHLETDVHLTADGRLVAFHDDRLDRVTDGTGLIRDLPWSEVRQASIGGVERIPLLSEVLDTVPGARLNLDLKAPGTAAPAWETIRSRGLQDEFCVGSFSQRAISAFRRLSRGAVATAASQAGTALMALGPRWVSRLVRTPADVLQIPTTATIRERTLQLVTPRLVEVAHRHGKQVHVWTIDDADEMHRLLDLGVDGIVSDRIDVLRDVLVERGTWTGR
jgi:glycerophosphoryl diester phosphodiesterase